MEFNGHVKPIKCCFNSVVIVVRRTTVSNRYVRFVPRSSRCIRFQSATYISVNCFMGFPENSIKKKPLAYNKIQDDRKVTQPILKHLMVAIQYNSIGLILTN
jgi:hypothetical protein